MVSLLMSISTIAQVRQIFEPERKPTSSVTPKIKIEDNELFVITPKDVYSQELDKSGNLIGETLLPSEIFEFVEFEIRDFVVSGSNIIAVTNKTLNEKNAILSSNDNGKTWTALNDWSNLDYYNYIQRASLQRGEYGKVDEFFLVIGYQIIYTSNFGKTWDKKGLVSGDYIQAHPFDSKISISKYQTTADVLDNQSFRISYDYGVNWEYTCSFVLANDVAFHYSNPDIIALIGDKVVISKDRGKTWGLTHNFEYYNSDLFLLKSEFDHRGTDRLYASQANNIIYSDDFGVTWNKLCEIGDNESNYIADFVQNNTFIYCISKNFKVYQIDLELLESAVEEVSIDDGRVSVSVVGNNLQINSQTTISNVDIFNIGGVKIAAQESPANSIDISNLANGTYIARLQAVNGNTVSVKFNK